MSLRLKPSYFTRINKPNPERKGLRKTFIEAEGNEAVFSICGDQLAAIPEGFKNEAVYHLERFREAEPPLYKDKYNKKKKKKFLKKTNEAVENEFEKSLGKIDFSSIQNFYFQVHVGKTIYKDKTDERSLFRNEDGSLSLDGCSPVYLYLVKQNLRDEIFSNLDAHGFRHLNEKSPKQWTDVHVYYVEKKAFFSVKLALDGNLEEVQEKDEGAGLSTEKKKYSARDESSLDGRPAKVISVKRRRKKVVDITLVTEKLLDLRAAIETRRPVDEEEHMLRKHVRSVINQGWHKKDADGGIPLPGGNTGIFIRQVKEVCERHVWEKEITTSQGQRGRLEVKVSTIRSRMTNNPIWYDGMEIYMRVKLGGVDEKQNLIQDKSVLAEKFKIIQDEWDHICPEN